jgi:nucleotide-binding universal stress UspA family protein
MFNTIIIGVDGSEAGWRALKYARNMAEKYDAKLIMVHAYPRTSDLHDCDGYDNLLFERKSSGQKIIETGRKLIGASPIAVEEDLLEGPAADAILSVVQVRHADLVVIGSRGMGAIKGMIFGSVATKVSHHADCPVMIVR